MSAADAQAEPTMEEILASIRRIISEDDVGASSAPAPEAVQPHEEVLELSEPVVDMPASVEPEYDFDLAQNDYDSEPAPHVFDEPNSEQTYDGIDVEDRWSTPIPAPSLAPAYVPEPPPVREAYQPQPAIAREPMAAFASRGDEGLVSDPVAATTSQVFSKLSPSHVFPEIFSSGNTVEALVVEMLKPMLKEWLDANLPRIVEDKVESEVARIARRSF